MSVFVLDDQLSFVDAYVPLSQHYSVKWLRELRPRQQIPDERIPELLRTLDRPTLVTIDKGMWDRQSCHPDYCILAFALTHVEQRRLVKMLRGLFRSEEFATRSARMGKVARIQPAHIDWWEFRHSETRRITWAE